MASTVPAAAMLQKGSILHTEMGGKLLSSRAKENLSVLRELSTILKRQALLQDEYIKGGQKINKALEDLAGRPDTRGQTLGRALSTLAGLHERLSDVDAHLARTLLTLHEEAQENSRELERRRKSLKESAARQERQLLDEEIVRDKAIAKCEQLDEEWSRLTRGDNARKPNFTFKSSRAGQQKTMDELKSKIESAQNDRDARILSSSRTLQALVSQGRPRSIAAFLELLQEIDAGVSSLLMRTAHAQEDSLLQKSMLAVAEGQSSEVTSGKSIVASIDHEKDLEDWLATVATTSSFDGPVNSQNLTQLHATERGAAADNRTETESLAMITTREGSEIPHLMSCCIGYIDRYGLGVEGLYRVPAHPAELSRVRALLSSSKDLDRFAVQANHSTNEVHAVASIIKQFLRDLPDALVPHSSYDSFIASINESSEQAKRIALHQAVNELPDANYCAIRYIAQHLCRVAEDAEHNKMTLDNLSIVWSPAVFGSRSKMETAHSATLHLLLLNCDQIFDQAEPSDLSSAAF